MPARSYATLANYYDLIYHELVDYSHECDILEKIFREHSEIKVLTILDMGCGTGNHDFILAKRGYNITGIDQSREMISIARKKLGKKKNPTFYTMDMRKLKLRRRFDVALVLFGAFGYLLKENDAEAMLRRAAKLVKGIMIFEFWQKSGLHPDATTPQGYTGWVRITDKEQQHELIRLDRNRFVPKRRAVTIDFEYYVLDRKQSRILDEFSERHVLRIYTQSEMKTMLESNGWKLQAFYNKKMEHASQDDYRVLCVAKS